MAISSKPSNGLFLSNISQTVIPKDQTSSFLAQSKTSECMRDTE